jgi:hypothetical protein
MQALQAVLSVRGISTDVVDSRRHFEELDPYIPWPALHARLQACCRIVGDTLRWSSPLSLSSRAAPAQGSQVSCNQLLRTALASVVAQLHACLLGMLL